MQMLEALKRASATSRLSTVEIPCRTVDAIGKVKELARQGDVIVSDSAPLAYEFLQKAGEATDCFGERYTQADISLKVRRFYACQELKRQGVNPYERRPYRSADRKRLLRTLKELLESASGVAPRNVPLKPRRPPQADPPARPLPALEFEKGPDAKVFVDGDACPQLPTILEVCGTLRRGEGDADRCRAGLLDDGGLRLLAVVGLHRELFG